MPNFLTNIPHTDAGSKLNLTPEEEKQLQMVYRENEVGLLYFSGIYNPETEYDEKDYIIPFRSTFDAFELLTQGTDFANVCGSSGDKAEYRWKDFYEKNNHTDEWECRAESNKYYTSTGVTDKPCNGWTCGGHVVMGKNNLKVVNGSSAVGIYIIPICTAHNVCGTFGATGTGYYMKLKADTHAIKLKGIINK